MKINNINSAYNLNNMPQSHGPLTPDETKEVQNIQAQMKGLIDLVNKAQGEPKNQKENDLTSAQQQVIGLQQTMVNLYHSNPQAFSQATPNCLNDLKDILTDIGQISTTPDGLQRCTNDMNAVIGNLQNFLNGGDY